MAKQIIILQVTQGPGGDKNISALFWFPVTNGQQIPDAGISSAFRGASLSELAALQNGSVVERPFNAQYPAAYTSTQIQTEIQAAYTAAATKFNSLPNPNQLYGTFWDGSAWQASAGIPPGIFAGLQFGSLIISASGDTTVIPGIAGQSIALYQLQIAAASAVTVLVKDGATTRGGYVFPTGGGSPVILPNSGVPWYVTGAGNNFVLNLSGAVNTIISGWYKQA